MLTVSKKDGEPQPPLPLLLKWQCWNGCVEEEEGYTLSHHFSGPRMGSGESDRQRRGARVEFPL